MQRTLSFFYDPISPYAWLAWRPLSKLVSGNPSVVLEPIPVLFAGLLNSNGQLGPAEIPRKRDWLICDVARRARSQGLAVCPPPSHPFNPLLSLRVASIEMPLAQRQRITGALLDAVWMKGLDISKEEVLVDVLNECEVQSPETWLRDAQKPDVKERLRDQTNTAISRGVFGVPTVILDGELFWGSESDTMEHLRQILQDPACFRSDAKLVETWRKIRPTASRIRYAK